MIWEVSAINATTTNSQNGHENDMRLEDAVMTFDNVSIEQLVFGAYKSYDSNHTLIASAEATAAQPEQYLDIWARSTHIYCYIFGMNELLKVNDRKYRVCFTIDGGAGFYDLTFTFSASTIQWDNYSSEAWYEHPQWKKK